MLSRPFVVLYIAVFVATLGISMVSPLLGVFAEELGASGILIALTFSVFAPMQAIMGPFAGKLSDRFGRKMWIVLGLGAYLIAALGYLFAGNVWHVIFFRAISGLGTSFIFSVGRAYIGDMVPPGKEGRWFGVFATADIMGFGIGPFFAGTIRAVFGFDAVFVAMALLMAASAVIVFTLLPPTPPQVYRREDGEDEPELSILAAMRNRLVLGVTVNQAVYSLAWGSLSSFLAIKLEDDLAVTAFWVGAIFSLQNITSAIAQPIMGRIADITDRRYLLAWGVVATAISLAAVGLATQLWHVVVLMLLLGGAMAVAVVSASAIQVYVGRRVGMGTVLGIGSAGSGWGIFAGSLASGALVQVTGNVDMAFFLGGALMLLGVPLFLWLMRGLETREIEAVLSADDEGLPAIVEPAPAVARFGPTDAEAHRRDR